MSTVALPLSLRALPTFMHRALRRHFSPAEHVGIAPARPPGTVRYRRPVHARHWGVMGGQEDVKKNIIRRSVGRNAATTAAIEKLNRVEVRK